MALKDWKRYRRTQDTEYDLMWINKNQVDGIFVTKRSLGYVWGFYGFTTGTEFAEGIEETNLEAVKKAKSYMRSH